jgi:hypothetical protein
MVDGVQPTRDLPGVMLRHTFEASSRANSTCPVPCALEASISQCSIPPPMQVQRMGLPIWSVRPEL